MAMTNFGNNHPLAGSYGYFSDLALIAGGMLSVSTAGWAGND
jgi:hypothetical protein